MGCSSLRGKFFKRDLYLLGSKRFDSTATVGMP
jgi:hypothetical protein